ncbi:MAG TPA: hypothetical protein DEH02_14725 [Bacteroidales bacterium]|nr:MAG: hypothetical protein A2X01_15100 [Bacteroidetes bacterium GWF2_35_48]OFY96958.1 MAG: hypothetical protein A2491_10425 [Bacteroidetes bacterium RIFOXYC12_FULL_35_7]HBX52316.1 hypothetical protein [Bacteroidales bacterium]
MSEKYEGVKFRTVFKSKDIPVDLRLETLKMWAKKFDEYRLAPPYDGGSAGNLSYRVNSDSNKFIITGSRIGLKCSLQDDCFVMVENCDFSNGIVYASGVREPSSEAMLHFAIYDKRKDVQAIFHGHSQEILDAAKTLKLPATSEFYPYGTKELLQSVILILEKHSVIIMKDHGFIALGASMGEAGKLSLQLIDRFQNE